MRYLMPLVVVLSACGPDESASYLESSAAPLVVVSEGRGRHCALVSRLTNLPLTREACGACWGWCEGTGGAVWMGLGRTIGACELATLVDSHGSPIIGLAWDADAARASCGW